MDVITDVDLVFVGNRQDVDLSFLEHILSEGAEVRFSDPENCHAIDYESILEVVNKEDVVFFFIESENFEMSEAGYVIVKPFMSVYIDDSGVEFLIFFDLRELRGYFEEKMSLIRSWMLGYSSSYHFNYFRCQIGNGTESGEYYFDSAGFGSLYYEVV